MTDLDLETCFLDAEDTEAFIEWADEQPPDEAPEVPDRCERNGCEFGGFFVVVGDRHVCSNCEQDEYEDYHRAQRKWMARRLAFAVEVTSELF